MIDVHTHLHPPRLFAAIRRWFADRSPWPIDHPSEPAEIARVILENGVEEFAFCSYAHKPGIARDLNEWLAQTARDLGPRTHALCTVHLDDASALDDARAALDDGCIGLKIHEDVQRLQIDDTRFMPILALLAEREGFVLVHAGHIPWSDETNDAPRRIAGVLDRHPTLRVTVAHLGTPDTRAYFALHATYPHLFTDTTMALVHEDFSPKVGPADLEAAHGMILYGSDYPNIPYPYERERETIEALGLSTAARRAIFHENALRLSPAFGRVR
ncbi:MAG: amidohydrolase family protein [Candidatus Velthaea sp.]|jgi:predicted TIM-barrel fold metal-dependent hydrolase